MSWKSCLLLLLVLVCGALAQKSAGTQWKEYAYPDAGFAVTEPVGPRIYPDPKAPDVRVYHWDLAPNILFVIHSGNRPNCLQVVENFKAALQRGDSKDIVPGSMKDISLSGNPGVEYEWREGTARRTLSRLYCAKEKAYDLTVAYPASQAKPIMADRVFSSFRLLNAGSH
jgi:hypothetical protein